jgi:hypothetical protein
MKEARNLGSGATVAQLTLDQKVEGSNPSSPANKIWWSDVPPSTICRQIPGFVHRAQTPGYRVIRVSDVLSDADA